ncbi:hypothetical protein [Micromonospora chersina]|uniref:hypothetical protein n=1 Tax=Micromonospora chersina TaxID=47854 RepID=UPI00371A436E
MTNILVDERLQGLCVFCGLRIKAKTKTRDHAPPKAFLDEPYPVNLQQVGSCEACNGGASLDEQFVACLLEVAVCGTVDPAGHRRPKIARTLADNGALAAYLRRGLGPEGYRMTEEDGRRLVRVLEKMGRALWAHQSQEPTGTLAASVGWSALEAMTEAQRSAFLSLSTDLYPEVGSRMFIRTVESGANAWMVIQEGRFAYGVEVLGEVGRIKLIVGDYLAGQIDLMPETEGSWPEQSSWDVDTGEQ